MRIFLMLVGLAVLVGAFFYLKKKIQPTVATTFIGSPPPAAPPPTPSSQSGDQIQAGINAYTDTMAKAAVAAGVPPPIANGVAKANNAVISLNVAAGKAVVSGAKKLVSWL